MQQREKMSLTELSERTGRPKKTLSKWLSGEQSPARPQMLKACQALGLDAELLSVTDGRFHDLWRKQHLTFEVLQRRYKDLEDDRQSFEARLIVNMAGVLLLREMAQHGHPMRLTTSDLGDVQLVATHHDELLGSLSIRVSGNLEQGLIMAAHSLSTQSILHQWISISVQNVVLFLEGCGKLKANEQRG